MIEFGKTLRAARESKGLTPGQIAEKTHMMVQMVEGLEKEDFSKIVAPIYGRGFVKLYCEAVGLEPKPLVDAFMEIYSGNRGASATKPEPATPPQTPVKPIAPEPPPATTRPIAPEAPQKVQTTIDFSAPASVVADSPSPAQPSRYAAPMPIDDGFSMPIVNWRMIALGAAAVAILLIAIFGVRALYCVTMTAPTEEEVETTEVTAPAPTPTETKTEAQTPTKAPVDRKPLPLKPFYIDSNHQTETEK